VILTGLVLLAALVYAVLASKGGNLRDFGAAFLFGAVSLAAFLFA
jgi:hypothetical protein